MVKVVQHNRLFFSLFSLFIVAGGIYAALSDKADAIWFFSENRSNLADMFFRLVTHFGEAFIYFLIGIIFLMIRVRHALLVGITGFIVLIVSSVLKAYFAQDRPLAFIRKQQLEELLNVVKGVDVHTGTTSFPSGHAMSAFALYSLLIFLIPKRKRFIVSLFSLAFLVGLSRVYLTQHFWLDVYTGGIIGVLIAMMIYTVNNYITHSSLHHLDNPIIYRSKVQQWFKSSKSPEH